VSNVTRSQFHVLLANVRRAGNPGAADAAARALALPANLRLDGAEPVAVTIPHLRVESAPNRRGHWGRHEPLRRQQRAMIALFLGRMPKLPRLPASVRLVRIYGGRGKPFDDDNLAAGLKACRDAVAELYGVSDAPGSPLAFAVAQERGEAGGVRVEIHLREAT
jgi:hypothetical protein